MTRRLLFSICLTAFFLIINSCQTKIEPLESPNIGKMIGVPEGTFHRDSHKENTSQVGAFYISQYEITREQFINIAGTDPSDMRYTSSIKDPVQNVNWYQAIAFCNMLSILEGLHEVYSVEGVDFKKLTFEEIPVKRNAVWDETKADWEANGYRLPTEMEWQWAAMGAHDDKDQAFSGSNGKNSIDDYAWYYANAGDEYLDDPWSWENIIDNHNRTHETGKKLPNMLEIFDMSGNVWEFCWDMYGQNPVGPVKDYHGPEDGDVRVYRGGGWHYDANYMAVAFRYMIKPDSSQPSVGIRLVRNASK